MERQYQGSKTKAVLLILGSFFFVAAAFFCVVLVWVKADNGPAVGAILGAIAVIGLNGTLAGWCAWESRRRRHARLVLSDSCIEQLGPGSVARINFTDVTQVQWHLPRGVRVCTPTAKMKLDLELYSGADRTEIVRFLRDHGGEAFSTARSDADLRRLQRRQMQVALVLALPNPVYLLACLVSCSRTLMLLGVFVSLCGLIVSIDGIVCRDGRNLWAGAAFFAGMVCTWTVLIWRTIG